MCREKFEPAYIGPFQATSSCDIKSDWNYYFDMRFKNTETEFFHNGSYILGHGTLFNNFIIPSVSNVSCEDTLVIQAEI